MGKQFIKLKLYPDNSDILINKDSILYIADRKDYVMICLLDIKYTIDVNIKINLLEKMLNGSNNGRR